MSAAEHIEEMKLVVTGAPAELVDQYWEGVLEPHFQDFERATHGDLSAEELRDDVRTSARQMWIAFDVNTYHVMAVALTRVERGTLWLEFCNGVHRELWQDDMVNAVMDFARKLDKRLICYARTGWAKHLKKFGMKETHRIFEYG